MQQYYTFTGTFTERIVRRILQSGAALPQNAPALIREVFLYKTTLRAGVGHQV